MEFIHIVRELIDIVSKLLVPVVGWGVWTLRDIRGELRRTGNVLIELNTWKAMHDQSDAERHTQFEREITRLRDQQEAIRHNLFGNGSTA